MKKLYKKAGYINEFKTNVLLFFLIGIISIILTLALSQVGDSQREELSHEFTSLNQNTMLISYLATSIKDEQGVPKGIENIADLIVLTIDQPLYRGLLQQTTNQILDPYFTQYVWLVEVSDESGVRFTLEGPGYTLLHRGIFYSNEQVIPNNKNPMQIYTVRLSATHTI